MLIESRGKEFHSPMLGEKLFRAVLVTSTLLVTLLVAGIFVTLVGGSLESIGKFGLRFLFSTTWDPVKGVFGAATFIVGTLLTSFIALAISLPFSLGVGILLGEYYNRGAIAGTIGVIIDLLASIPSVVYGFWGIAVLVPLVRGLETKIGVTPYGVGIFTSSLILAVMIVPYSASIASEVIRLVPIDMKRAAYALGSTRYEVVRKIVLTYAQSGILAGIMLSLGRALGETMAVTMVIGNVSKLPTTIFSPGNTLASVIASEFTESTSALHQSAMIELALVLFLITTLINWIAHQTINRMRNRNA